MARSTRLSPAVTLGTLVSMAWLSAPSFATNGYFSHGIAMDDKGLGGAGVANPTSALAVDTNPASLVSVGENNALAFALFSPMRSYDASGGMSPPAGAACNPSLGDACPFTLGNDGNQALDSEGELFLIPSFAMSRAIDDSSAWGVAFVARGGMNTRWKGGEAVLSNGTTMFEGSGTFGSGTVYSDLKQLYLKATYSRRLSDAVDLGASLVYHYQGFEAKGLGNFAGYSVNPTKVTNNDMDYSGGIGVHLGINAKVSEHVTISASYQPKTDMGEFDEYSGLFAEGGDFDLPASMVLGTKIMAGGYKILADVQVIEYSGVTSLGTGIEPLTNLCAMGEQSGCLGADGGPGFGWEDMTILKLGVEKPLANGSRLQVGFSTGDQPIPDTEVLFNILAPAVIENHLTLGYDMTVDGKGMQFAFMYAFSNSISGANTLNPSQTIELEMDQWELSFGYQF